MVVFINKGDEPLEYRQAVKRGLRYFEQEKAYWQREQGIVENDPEYLAWASQWLTDNKVNEANNIFNHQLKKYKIAVDRLAQYKLSEGREEITEEQPTGLLDDDGNEIIETVIIQSAVEPQPLEIEQPVYDEVTGEQIGTILVPNSAVLQDEAERASAQEVIDNTPVEVIEFVAGDTLNNSINTLWTNSLNEVPVCLPQK